MEELVSALVCYCGFLCCLMLPPPPCRHRFFEDVEELRAKERARNDAKRMEILERRQRQMEELAEKKRGGGT